MKQFFANTTFPIWLRSKNAIRRLSTFIEVCFFHRHFFVSTSIKILRNLNHYHICKGEKKKFQTITTSKVALSPQIKWYMISSRKNIIYKLSHELSIDLKLRTWRNQEILRISQKWQETEPSSQSSFSKYKIGTSGPLRKNRLQSFPVPSNFACFLEIVS